MTAINQVMKDAEEMDVFSAQLKEWVKAERPRGFKNYNLIKAQNRKQSLEQSPSFVSK